MCRAEQLTCCTKTSRTSCSVHESVPFRAKAGGDLQAGVDSTPNIARNLLLSAQELLPDESTVATVKKKQLWPRSLHKRAQLHPDMQEIKTSLRVGDHTKITTLGRASSSSADHRAGTTSTTRI